MCVMEINWYEAMRRSKILKWIDWLLERIVDSPAQPYAANPNGFSPGMETRAKHVKSQIGLSKLEYFVINLPLNKWTNVLAGAVLDGKQV